MPHNRARRSIEAAVTIDGHDLVWTLRREPKWHTDGYKGLAISVTLAQGNARELLLEYPYPKYKPGLQRKAERPRILPQVIARDIRAAMAAGWNPLSRGRVFTFQVAQE